MALSLPHLGCLASLLHSLYVSTNGGTLLHSYLVIMDEIVQVFTIYKVTKWIEVCVELGTQNHFLKCVCNFLSYWHHTTPYPAAIVLSKTQAGLIRLLVMSWGAIHSSTTKSEAWYIMVKGYYSTPSTLGYQPVNALRLAEWPRVGQKFHLRQIPGRTFL